LNDFTFLVPPPPVIKFTQPVYNASESGNAVVGISVTDGKVTEPVTVRYNMDNILFGGTEYFYGLFSKKINLGGNLCM
jgi:hypothetical protein